MTLLAQQELLVPPPTRRLIVPHGHDGWFGVDPSTQRVSLAWKGADGARGVRTMPFAQMDGGPARLSAIYVATRDLMRDVLLELGRGSWPGVVIVEQPSGSKQSVNLPLIYAVGVVQAALHDAVVLVTGHPVRMETCTSSWWKARACGKGNIYKPKRHEPHEYGVLTWARENGYEGSSWDEADAWGIAEAASREIALDPR